MLTIVSPMEEELAGVRQALTARDMPGAAALHVIGVGRDAIEPSLRGLLHTLRQARGEDGSPSGLLLLGFAGAVDPSLSTGDLVLAGRYCHLRDLGTPLVCVPEGMTLEEFERREMAELVVRDPNLPQRAVLQFEEFEWRGQPRMWASWRARDRNLPSRAVLKFLEPDRGMWQHARYALTQGGLQTPDLAWVETDSMTAPYLVTNPDTKRELHRQYHVSTVNMEDYWVARLAAAARVPFLSVRAVLDTADQRLPSFLMELPGRPGWAALHALVQPHQVPTLFRLMRQMPLAQESLAKFALAFIDYQQKTAAMDPGASP